MAAAPLNASAPSSKPPLPERVEQQHATPEEGLCHSHSRGRYRTRRTLWLSDASDRQLLVSQSILSAREGGERAGPAALSSRPDEPLTSLQQAQRVVETLSRLFPVRAGGAGSGAAWLDFVHPTSAEVRTVLSWFAASLPHLLVATRHWIRLHVKDEADGSPSPSPPSSSRLLYSTSSKSSGIDHVEYYPSYGYGLLQFTALREKRHHEDEDEDAQSSTSSSSSSSRRRSATDMVVVSALLFERSLITFRNGYFKDEDELVPQWQWCMLPHLTTHRPVPERSLTAMPYRRFFTSSAPKDAPHSPLRPHPLPSLSPLTGSSPVFPVVVETPTAPHGGEAKRVRSARHLASLVLSTTLCAVVEDMKQSSLPLLIETNTVDELALSMRPSLEDQDDLLRRMRTVRRRLQEAHLHLLRKEVLIQQLLMSSPHHHHEDEPGTRSALEEGEEGEEEETLEEVNARYLHALYLTRLAIESIRRGRDTINLSSMSVMSGVVARLGQHCHWMDYVNTLQSQIALLVMPINIIPGIMSCNVRVPFQTSDSKAVFWIIAGITLFILVGGLGYPFYKYYRYALPGSIAPL